MLLKNAEVFNQDFDLVQTDLSIHEDRIAEIAPCLSGEETVDLSGCIVAPGFVDIHIHGCAGADTCDGTRGAIETMAKHLITKGVTSFCPTTMTVAMTQIRSALSVVRDCMEHPVEGARVCGVNMEGPYISAHRKGAQDESYVRTPDWREFEELFRDCGGIIKLVDIAPEQENADDFIEHAAKLCTVSMAHTDADYDRAKAAFEQGITHVTHLYNAMTGLNHRTPGAVGAVFDNSDVKAEIICDGVHIHPAVLRLSFRLLGEDRTVIVSDSLRAAGLADGLYDLGGQQVFVKDGRARLADGTIAGSTTNLLDEIRNLVRFGLPLRRIIKSATINPAAAIGMDDRIGSIKTGKSADLVVLNRDFTIRKVMVGGKFVF
ncbi:N-acetylglucosamine-6-phosphate deacetylase [Caprobacter fermentans]|uniref:N-acetylglucosamine-6-phosphate deacetylase n=1 Tax=Caproicibacter fermentans TaxID=2576756 RepID=A0A6N8HWH3_9FIRM|nr:N-acetylglucosamine-6-phosphate deacetylase [Caproicibacter fermentans]MVB10146.1 N-acetylglucosamine-6-phosphate deacetylase [Caproicibacter fermentans]